MQTRAQSVVVQVCLALLCSLGAGFSGDMQSRTAGHGGSHSRHTRGNPHRSARANGRDTHGDHAHEIELAQEATLADSAVPASTDQNNAVAVPAARPARSVQWTVMGLVLPDRTGFARTASLLRLPVRAPPFSA